MIDQLGALDLIICAGTGEFDLKLEFENENSNDPYK
jgi:hypothetical protein